MIGTRAHSGGQGAGVAIWEESFFLFVITFFCHL